MKTFLSIILIAAFSITSFNQVGSQDIHEILKKFSAAVDKYDQVEFDFKSKERRDKGNYIETIGHFKVWEGPNKKVAADLDEPDNANLLWRKGENDNKVSAKLGILPWINLSLTSSRFLDKSHHTIDNAGFGLPKRTIMTIYNSRKAEIADAVEMKGDINYDGHTCMHIIINDKNHGTTTYTVKEGDNLSKIAYAKAINQMQILELNPDIKNYWDVEAGDVITIPNSFGTKITIYLDKTLYMPRYFKVEDKKGIVGEYNHLKLNISPNFTDDDFQKSSF